MKLAVSTLAMPSALDWLGPLSMLGFAGIEIAPAQTWADADPDFQDVSKLGLAIRRAGLAVAGLHGLLQNQAEAGLFRGSEARFKAAERIVFLSGVCRDLGGRTLVLGGKRNRGELDDRTAWDELLALLDAVLPRIEAHGTVLCLDTLSPRQADFCLRTADCRMLVGYADHPALGIAFNSAALTENGELGHAPFAAVRGRLDIFHACEPDLGQLGAGQVDHDDFRRHLAATTYRDWVSLHQRADAGLEAGASALRRFYLRTAAPLRAVA